ncbi:MAG TPA: adenylyl-sulfate kinase, partial [Candidatus Obscuribacterales bacterium]
MDTSPAQEITRVVVVGHVDHGKSTLLGRILLDCARVPEEKIESVRKVCQAKGIPFEPAFLFDALQEEQEQGISIDTTRVNFQFDGRRFLLIDAPGHLEFLKNMTSGASEADIGIVVVDCHEGIRSQTARHLKILSVLGITEIIVVVNKLDKVGYDAAVFGRVSREVRELADGDNLRCVEIVPVSALGGENITLPSKNLDWYDGQPLLPTLCSITAGKLDFRTDDEPFRMVLQDVYKFNDQRYFAGRVMSGEVKPGDEIFFSPSGKVSRVEAIEVYPARDMKVAVKGNSIALRLADQVFVERGEVVSFKQQAPEIDSEFRARIAWLAADMFNPAREYLLKIGTQEAMCAVVLLDPSGEISRDPALPCNGDFAEVLIKSAKPLAFDTNGASGGINKLVLCTEYETVAAGVVDSRPARVSRVPVASPNIKVESGYVERRSYEVQQGHAGSVVWLTGLSGAGKSTLAKAIQRRLFEQRYKVVVLDGDNLRNGLCADLGFSPEDRSENIRRIAHVAKLFLDSGCIVLVACISPYTQDREVARTIIGASDFNEVFVFCPLEVCQQRDPKGLYKKVHSGQVNNFTGFHSPYQSPKVPDLRLDSSQMTVDEEVDAVLALLERRRVLVP